MTPTYPPTHLVRDEAAPVALQREADALVLEGEEGRCQPRGQGRQPSLHLALVREEVHAQIHVLPGPPEEVHDAERGRGHGAHDVDAGVLLAERRQDRLVVRRVKECLPHEAVGHLGGGVGSIGW